MLFIVYRLLALLLLGLIGIALFKSEKLNDGITAGLLLLPFILRILLIN